MDTNFIALLLHFFNLGSNFYDPAPEMLKGDLVGPPADVWTLGVVAFIMWVLIDVIPDTSYNVSKKGLGINMSSCIYFLQEMHSRYQIMHVLIGVIWKDRLLSKPIIKLSYCVFLMTRLSGRLPFQERDPLQTEAKIHMAKFEPAKLYPNVSQSASAFLKKMLSSYPW